MTTIHKYTLKVVDVQKVRLPKGAKILSIQNQSDTITFWVLGEYEFNKEDVTFVIYGDAKSVAPYDIYIGTVQMNNGDVWHIFKATI